MENFINYLKNIILDLKDYFDDSEEENEYPIYNGPIKSISSSEILDSTNNNYEESSSIEIKLEDLKEEVSEVKSQSTEMTREQEMLSSSVTAFETFVCDLQEKVSAINSQSTEITPEQETLSSSVAAFETNSQSTEITPEQETLSSSVAAFETNSQSTEITPEQETLSSSVAAFETNSQSTEITPEQETLSSSITNSFETFVCDLQEKVSAINNQSTEITREQEVIDSDALKAAHMVQAATSVLSDYYAVNSDLADVFASYIEDESLSDFSDYNTDNLLAGVCDQGLCQNN